MSDLNVVLSTVREAEALRTENKQLSQENENLRGALKEIEALQIGKYKCATTGVLKPCISCLKAAMIVGRVLPK